MNELDEKVIWDLNDIMAYTKLGRKSATALINMKGCPLIKRHKGQRYMVVAKSFKIWLENGGPTK